MIDVPWQEFLDRLADDLSCESCGRRGRDMVKVRFSDFQTFDVCEHCGRDAVEQGMAVYA